MRSGLILTTVLCLLAPQAAAHELRPAYLELTQTSPDSFDVRWKVPSRGEDLRLGLYVRFSQDVQTVTAPRSVCVGDAFVDRWTIRHPYALAGSTVQVDGLRATLTDVLLRINGLDGTTRIARLTPTEPSFVVPASPGPWQHARTYGTLGVEHILLGIDHLLFVLALILIVRGPWRLLKTITAFTVAHSITLVLATLGCVQLPGPPVDAAIALSIVFVAAELIHLKQGRRSLTARQPWMVAFSFGLLHGFGFAGALSDIGLPVNAVPLALLCFNVGVELGQILFLVAVLGLIGAFRSARFALPGPLQWIPPYAIGSVAMFWVIERVGQFL